MLIRRIPFLMGIGGAILFAGFPLEKAESVSLRGVGAAKSNIDAPIVPFPERPGFALTGSEFLRVTAAMDPAARERAILAEIQNGNVPSHIRRMVPVKISYLDHQATIYVLPDYLAVGSDDDYVIIPMAPRTAMMIANQFGFTLPTTKPVDEIYQNATIRLTPDPLTPSREMTSNNYYRAHDLRIKQQLARSSGLPVLLGGHKKDVVLTPRLSMLPARVAIYGWHRLDGTPIQPLSLVHGIEYVDYSHGVRLISRQAYVDGVEVDLSQILSDSELNPLVSDEGRFSAQGYL